MSVCPSLVSDCSETVEVIVIKLDTVTDGDIVIIIIIIIIIILIIIIVTIIIIIIIILIIIIITIIIIIIIIIPTDNFCITPYILHKK